MTEHLTHEQIKAYRSRTLPVRALFRVSEHAASCEGCAAQIHKPGRARLEATVARARLELSGAHLTYDNIEEHVKGCTSGDDLSRVSDHLAMCSMCSKDVDAIVKLAASPAPLARGLKRQSLTWFWTGGVGALACAAAFVVISLAFPKHRSSVVPAGGNQSALHGNVAAPSGSAIHDGDRVVSLAGGSLTGLDGLPEAYRNAVATALASGRLAGVVSSEALKPIEGHGVLMGEGDTVASRFRLIKPVAEVVGEQNPLFEWTPENGAVYDVSVGDSDFNQVAHSGWIRTNSWQVPIALERGKTYSWQVVFRRDGRDVAVPAPPLPAAHFKILSAPESAELDRLQERFGSSHLVMGTALARFGMWDPATDQFEALQRENPDSPIASELLTDLRKLRRRTGVERQPGRAQDLKRPRRLR